MLFEPEGGASVKVNVYPSTLYATVGSWRTFSTITSISVGLTILRVSVNDVVDELPLKRSASN